MDIDYTTLMRDSDAATDTNAQPQNASSDPLASQQPSYNNPSSSQVLPPSNPTMDSMANMAFSYPPTQTLPYSSNLQRLPNTMAKAESLPAMFYLQSPRQQEHPMQQQQQQQHQHVGFAAMATMDHDHDHDKNQNQDKEQGRSRPPASSHPIPSHSSNSAGDSTGSPNDIPNNNDNNDNNGNTSSPNLSLNLADIDTSNMTRQELTILRRKIRNRESAKRSRIKKEREIQELELKFHIQGNEIDMLQKDNMRLRAQNQLLFNMIQRIQAGHMVAATGPNSGSNPGFGTNDRTGYQQ
mmetsp:Transcript_11687/g.20049  ORF Transcript_11687/g.20049 Transcript_11687/m.20049 type:complete len:296 (-) Transcript_11687:87-974(-)